MKRAPRARLVAVQVPRGLFWKIPFLPPLASQLDPMGSRP